MLITAQGGASSNSYATLRQADKYLVDLYGAPNLGTWNDLTPYQKEYRLQVACQMLDMLPLRGRRSFRHQSLAFPRYIPNDDRFDSRKVPVSVVRAQILIAYGIVHRGLATESSPDDGVAAGRVQSVGLSGLLSVSFANGPITGGTFFGSLIRTSEFPIYALLKPFVTQIRIRSARTSAERDLEAESEFTTSTSWDEPFSTTTTEAPLTTTTAAPVETTTTT